MSLFLDKNRQEKIIKRMIDDRSFRLAVTTRSLYWFSHFYFSKNTHLETAEFQKEMFQLLQSWEKDIIVIAAFRGSGKSTIVSLLYPIWAVLGIQQKKFVVILSLTQRQAEQHLLNVKGEFERNSRLINDLGPFKEERDQWGRLALVLQHCGAKIMAASTEQPIRGMRYGNHRPDLFVIDDVEDVASLEKKENRDKTSQWFHGDIVPAGEPGTKIAIVGGILHPDSFIVRMKKGIEENKIDGIFRAYPIIDEQGSANWPARFPTPESIETEKRKVTNEIVWQREFMLRIIEDDEQVIKKEWIRFYDEIPEDKKEYSFTAISIDPAVSQNESADFTAIVAADVYGFGDNKRIYIRPYPVNEKLSFQEIKDRAKFLSKSLGKGSLAKVYVEEVGSQGFITQELKNDGFPAEGVKIQGNKKFRLTVASAPIQSGKVFFPRRGTEKLIEQLLGFERESHDDLVDATSMLINQIMLDDYDPRLESLRTIAIY